MDKKCIEGNILSVLSQHGLRYWYKKKTNEKQQISTMEKIINVLSDESLRFTINKNSKDNNSVALFAVIPSEPEPELSFIFECEADDNELKKIKKEYGLLLNA